MHATLRGRMFGKIVPGENPFDKASATNSGFVHLTLISDCLRAVQGDGI
jgi:hypothetical protein